MENHQDKTPLEIIMEQNYAIQKINTSLLEYYKHEAPQIFEKNEKNLLELRNTMERGTEYFIKSLDEYFLKNAEIKMNLSARDSSRLKKTELQLKKFTQLHHYMFLILGLSIIVIFASAYLANNFYQSSILTKSEIRQGIIQEIQQEGNIITNAKNHRALINEKLMLSQFISKNEKFNELYSTYRDGVISNNQEEFFFSNVSSDKISK